MRDDMEYFIFEEMEKKKEAKKKQRPRQRRTSQGAISPKGRDESHIKPIRELLRINPQATLAETLAYLASRKVTAARRDIEFTYWLEQRPKRADDRVNQENRPSPQRADGSQHTHGQKNSLSDKETESLFWGGIVCVVLLVWLLGMIWSFVRVVILGL
jgi:hypothetical protein